MGDPEEQRLRVSLVRAGLRGDEQFAVTGASGWLGRTTLDLLAATLGEEAFSARVVGFASVARRIELRSGLVVAVLPLSELVHLDPAPTHILHFAFHTRDQVATMGVAPYVMANLAITSQVLHAVGRFRPRGVSVASSGAVYSGDASLATDIGADPYGGLKHLEELVLRRAVADAGGRSVVARIFSLGGAYITKPQLYALGELVQQAQAGGPLMVRARGPVVRSYCAATDVVAVMLACLLGDGDELRDVVFDTCGTVVEVGDLAERVRTVVGGPATTVTRRLDGHAPPDRYVGDGGAMTALAARFGLVLQTLDEQILDTASYLRGSPT